MTSPFPNDVFHSAGGVNNIPNDYDNSSGYLQPESVRKTRQFKRDITDKRSDQGYQNEALGIGMKSIGFDDLVWRTPDSPETMKGHDYEELPSTRVAPQFPQNDYLTTRSSQINEHVATFALPVVRPGQRRRDNPLYADAKSLHLKASSAQTRNSPCGYTLAAMLTICIIALVALTLATFAVLMYSNADNSELRVSADNITGVIEELRLQIRQLRQDNQLLRDQVTEVETQRTPNASSSVNGNDLSWQPLVKSNSDDVKTLNGQVAQLFSTYSLLSQQIEALSQTYTESLQRLSSAQTTQQTSLTDRLSDLETSLTDRFNNISKMAGPADSSGAVNMSQCYHSYDVNTEFSSKPETYSTVISSTSSDVITGLSCSTVGGTMAFLVYDDARPAEFRCVCRGKVSGSTSIRQCIIHHWKCPSGVHLNGRK